MCVDMCSLITEVELKAVSNRKESRILFFAIRKANLYADWRLSMDQEDLHSGITFQIRRVGFVYCSSI